MSEQAEIQTPEPPEKRRFQFGMKHLLALPVGIGAFFGVAVWWGMAPATLFLSVVLIAAGLAYRVTRRVTAVVAIVWVAFLITVSRVPHNPGPGARATCENNLKNLSLALLAYEAEHGRFPPAYIADENGRPMHSWRVLILPYLEQRHLYDQYDFSEPWDGPNNSKLETQVPYPSSAVYRCPAEGNKPVPTTSYVAVVGPNTVWPGSESTSLDDFGCDLSKTILLVEVVNSGIHWMEPRDLHVVQMAPTINPASGQGISSPHPAGANVAFADGHVRFLPESISPEDLRAMLTRSGGELVDLEGF